MKAVLPCTFALAGEGGPKAQIPHDQRSLVFELSNPLIIETPERVKEIFSVLKHRHLLFAGISSLIHQMASLIQQNHSERHSITCIES